MVFGRTDLHVWRWEAGGEARAFARFGGFGTEAAWFAPDGRSVYVDRGSGQLAVWDVAAGRQTALVARDWQLGACAPSPDGKILALAPYQLAAPPPGTVAVELVDPATGKEVGRLPAGRTGVGHVSWSADGTRVAAATDQQVWVWDVKTGRPLGPARPGHEGRISAIVFAPDGSLFTASDDHTVRTWDAAGKPGRVLLTGGWVRGLAVSRDGRLVAASALGNDVRVWEAGTGRERFKLLGHGRVGGKRVVRFAPDGARLVAWGDDEYLRVWDTRTGRLLAEHSTRPPGEQADPDDPFADRLRGMGMLGDPDVSPDGTVFALGAGTTVRLIDPMTGETRRVLDLAPVAATRVAFAPDGRRLAVAGRGQPVQTKLPDGRVQSGPGEDHPVAVWDVTAGKALWAVAAPGYWASDLAFTPDGARLAELPLGLKGGYSVQFRDAATGADAGRIDLPVRGWQFAFDRTGRRVAVSFSDTTATVFDIPAALAPSPGGKP